MSEDKLELARRMAADTTNYRKRTWESRITRWFPPRFGVVWVHVRMDREPDRPMTARMSVDQAQDMILGLVTGRVGGEAQRPGIFAGELDAISRMRLFGTLKGLGVPEDVAREVARVNNEA
jgi:hypothetical protein